MRGHGLPPGYRPKLDPQLGAHGAVKENLPRSHISRKSKSKEEKESQPAKFSEKMAKITQGVSYLNENIFDFFDLAVKILPDLAVSRDMEVM
jgi:hypothetical protein